MRMGKIILIIISAILLSACFNRVEYSRKSEDAQQAASYVNALLGPISENEESFFLLDHNASYLVQIDKHTGACAILCNKADCLHHEEVDEQRKYDCNAFVAGALSAPQYYNGNIYVDRYEQEAPPRLFAYNLDGTGFKQSVQIKNHASWYIYEDWVYYVYADFDGTKLPEAQHAAAGYHVMKQSLARPSEAPQVLYEKLGVFASAQGIHVINGKLVAKALAETSGSSAEDIRVAMNVIITDLADETSIVVEGLDFEGYQDDYIISMREEDGGGYSLAGFSLQTGEKAWQDSTISTAESCATYANDDYIFLDKNRTQPEKREIVVYDKERNSNTIRPGKCYYAGINDTYILFTGPSSLDAGDRILFGYPLADIMQPGVVPEILYRYEN